MKHTHTHKTYTYIFLQNYVHVSVSQKLTNMLKIFLGRTYADRSTKIIVVQDGRRNRKQACASYVSKSKVKLL